ncbi:MAG: helix-turn-helix transcriptional regulator [Verrucomicrobiales bacterium]|nr:helix-turn-helix transcriptional regulator [Verrucomicrobiales bacterium]
MAPSTEDAVSFFIRDLGAEIRSRRERLGISAYSLGRAGNVTDQTILNIEQGRCGNGCQVGTLFRIAERLGTTLPELITAALLRDHF